MKKVMSN